VSFRAFWTKNQHLAADYFLPAIFAFSSKTSQVHMISPILSILAKFSILGCGYKPGKCVKIGMKMTFNDLTFILHLYNSLKIAFVSLSGAWAYYFI
jgi:hypothetical protein